MKMNFKIEKMTKCDIQQLAQLEKQCFSVPWSEKALETELDNPNAVFLVAKEGDRVLGYIGSYLVAGEASVADFAVFSEYRCMGIGSGLLDYLCNYLKSSGAEFLSLEVRVSNSSAVSVYEKTGFIRAGTRKGCYEKPSEDGYVYIRYFKD